MIVTNKNIVTDVSGIFFISCIISFFLNFRLKKAGPLRALWSVPSV